MICKQGGVLGGRSCSVRKRVFWKVVFCKEGRVLQGRSCSDCLNQAGKSPGVVEVVCVGIGEMFQVVR